MISKNRLSNSLQKLIARGGTPIMVRYFTMSLGSVYDDDPTYTISGNDLWTSGIKYPINKDAGADSLLLQQGKLTHDDSKLFLHGSLLLTGSEMQVKIMIGSPGETYSIIPIGTNRYDVQSTPIYKSVYIRRIGGVGSLIGEV